MRLTERDISQAAGTILIHNIADQQGKRILKKGILLADTDLARLAEIGRRTVPVAVLEADDVREDDAASALALALQTEGLNLSRPAGGRVNLRTETDGLLEVDARRLLELNLIPGITLSTRRQYAVLGPNHESDNIGTLKIIPFAVPQQDLDHALSLAQERPALVRIRPFHKGRRASLLLVGEEAVHDKLRAAYLPPTRTRLERLGAELVTVEATSGPDSAIGQNAARLAQVSDLVIIAGQTSVMDDDDVTLHSLREAGAAGTLSGAPVEPGNLLALAYFPDTPVLCAPGCARGLKRNVVDLVLPRLLLGDCLDRRDIAELGLGGFLTAAERRGSLG